MIHLVWQATQVVFWLALYLAVTFGPLVPAWLVYDDSDSFVGVVALGASHVWAAIAVVAGFIWVINIATTSDGAHEWEDGRGPATVCRFESRDEWVGKVLMHVRYTVCE